MIKKQYILIALIIVFLYLLYLVITYTYNDYKIRVHIEEIQKLNEQLLINIIETERDLEQKMTLAHKNKILKTEQWLKNRNEEVLFLISEERYKMFTEHQSLPVIQTNTTINERIWDTHKLISSMTIYERWVYFLFWRDIR